MRTGRPKQPLTLTAEERERLESLAHRARTLPLLARRARIVLACADGLDNKNVGRRLRASLGMVGKWRARFLQDRKRGVEGKRGDLGGGRFIKKKKRDEDTFGV